MGTNILAMIDMLGLPIIKVVSTPCSQWQNYFCDIYFFNINLSLDEKKYFLTIKKLTFEHFLKLSTLINIENIYSSIFFFFNFAFTYIVIL